MPKSLFKRELDFETLTKYIYEPELRMKFDSVLKDFKILEREPNYCIFYTLLHSPIFFISERDLVDKRVSFIKDDVYYNLSTSVTDYYPLDNKAVRIDTYLNLLILRKDLNNYYFECFSQHDAKTIIPEKILNFTIPSRTQEWYHKYIEELKKFLETETEDKIDKRTI